MSILFTWRKRANIGLVLILFGFTMLAESIIVLHAQTQLHITSVFLLILVPIGVSLALSGVELLLAETIHRRFSTRVRRTSKWKTPQRTGFGAVASRLEVASILSALLVLAISFAAYFYVVGVLVGTFLPMYARFAAAETVSMLAVVTIGVVAEKIF